MPSMIPTALLFSRRQPSVVPPDPVIPALSWAPPRLTSRATPWDPTPDQPFVPEWYGIARDGTGVDVYILDTGLEDTLPGFGGRATYLGDQGVAPPAGFKDGNGHGTACASLIGVEGLGLATGALIWGRKVTTTATGFDFSNTSVASGIDAVRSHYLSRAATNRPAVLTMSFGGGTLTDEIVKTAIGECLAAGIIVICASGNSMQDIMNAVWPANIVGVLAVGATDQWDRLYYNPSVTPELGSNVGFQVPINVPGNLVTALETTYNVDPPGYRNFSGTSASAPLLAGLTACMLTGKPRLQNYRQVMDVIRKVLANATKDQVAFADQGARPIIRDLAYIDPLATTETFPTFVPSVDQNGHHAQTTLAVNFTGADGSTSFTDISPQSKTLIANGAAEIQSNRLRLPTNTSYVEVTPATTGFQLVQATPACPSFTVEMEIVFHALPTGGPQTIATYGPDGGTFNWIFQITSSGQVTFSARSGSAAVRTMPIMPAGTVELGIPYRIAVVSDGFAARAYVNGLQTNADDFIATMTVMSNLAGSVMRIGSNNNAADVSIGYFRVTPNAARYLGYSIAQPEMLLGPGPIESVGTYTSVYAASGTTRSIVIPAGVIEGDLVVATVMHRSALTAPAGWTLIRTEHDTGNNQYHSILSRVAPAGFAGTTVTFSQAASGRMLAGCFAARKAGGFTLREHVGGPLTINNPWVDLPPFTDASGPIFAVGIVGFWDNAGAMRPIIGPGFNLVAPHNSTVTRTSASYIISQNGLPKRLHGYFNRPSIGVFSGALAIWE